MLGTGWKELSVPLGILRDNRTEFCKCPFSTRPLHLGKQCYHFYTMQKQHMVCLVHITCLKYFKVLFDYLKVYHQIFPEPEMEQTVMLLISYFHIKCPTMSKCQNLRETIKQIYTRQGFQPNLWQTITSIDIHVEQSGQWVMHKREM